jgi:hypothetical protein
MLGGRMVDSYGRSTSQVVTTKRSRGRRHIRQRMVRSVLVATLALLMTVYTFGLQRPASGADGEDRLNSGEILTPGQALISRAGGYVLVMQYDGNLVLYAPGNRAIWGSGTAGRPGTVLRMQADGNLVLYAPGNRAIWDSGTHGRPGTVLVMQGDGNAVLYAPGDRAIWVAPPPRPPPPPQPTMTLLFLDHHPRRVTRIGHSQGPWGNARITSVVNKTIWTVELGIYVDNGVLASTVIGPGQSTNAFNAFHPTADWVGVGASQYEGGIGPFEVHYRR